IAVEKGLKYAQNLRQLWVSSDYHEQQRLQYLVFPEGMLYSKKNDEVLIKRINTLLGQIALLSRNSEKNEKGKPETECLFGSNLDSITLGSNEVRADLTALIEFSYRYR
ncbi:MAG: hypothetical protein ACKO6Q_00355, partial [Bacteroidota bacterium]